MSVIDLEAKRAAQAETFAKMDAVYERYRGGLDSVIETVKHLRTAGFTSEEITALLRHMAELVEESP